MIDTTNRHLVSVAREHVVIMNPPRSALTPAEARVLAAWLVVLADTIDDAGVEAFENVLDAVENA